MFFLVPDGPGLTEAIRGTGAIPVEKSRQSTNSWGLRGPEPDLDAPLRGIVLGDSFMQGMFIGDDDTPPECLRRDLEERLKTRVSILNTGHLGYSPEQYYFSLVEYADRFHPHFVVVSVFINDFAGEMSEVGTQGQGRLGRGQVLAGEDHSVVPLAWLDLSGRAGSLRAGLARQAQDGPLSRHALQRSEEPSLTFLDPSDDLLNAHLELVVAAANESARGLMAARSSTSRSGTATSQPWARKPGPRPWAGGSRSCSREIQRFTMGKH